MKDLKNRKSFWFFVVLILLFLSLALLIVGLLSAKKDILVTEEAVKNVEEESVSLSEYFKNLSESGYQDQTNTKDDPFREICADVSGDGVPSISSNTVCLR